MRAQTREACDSRLDFVGGNVQRLCNFCIAELQKILVFFFENADGKARKIRNCVCLDQEAFTLVAGTNAARLEGLQNVNRFAHREACVFELEFPTEHAFNLVNVLVVRLDNHRFGFIVAVCIAKESIVVNGVDEVLDQLAKMFFSHAVFLQLFLQFTGAVPKSELVFELFLQALAHVLDRAVPIFVRVLPARIQIVKRSVIVRCAITQIAIPVHIRRFAIEVAAIDIGGIVQRTASHVLDIIREFIRICTRIEFFRVLVDGNFLIVKVAIVHFQERIDFDFFLDGGFQFLRSFLKHLHRLEKRRR